MIRLDGEFLRHVGDDVGLRNGLPAGDRQGGILIGLVDERGVHKLLARDKFHRAKHAGVVDAVLAQHHDEADLFQRVSHLIRLFKVPAPLVRTAALIIRQFCPNFRFLPRFAKIAAPPYQPDGCISRQEPP